MNSVHIIGNLTRQPELRFTPNGKAVTNMTVAVSDRFNKENTYFFDVVVWNKTAELCAEWLDKGKKVGVTGRLTTRTYETQDGQKRKVVEIVADEIDFLTPKGSQSSPPPSQAKADDWSDIGSQIDVGDDIPF